MAIIACRECGHQVSTQAASCPNCGAPHAPAAESDSPGRRVLRRTLLGLAALAVVATALWFMHARFGSLAETALPWRTESAATRPVPASASASAPALPAARQPAGDIAAGQAAVYVTTAEQLYRDYTANAVATRSRIGSGLVRVTGSVTEIDEDLAGHPVVELASGGTQSTGMLLKDDQKGAVAQLIKGESVGIQCDKMQRDPAQHSGAPQGSGCVLVLIDAGAQPVYLAVSSANGREKTPLYIVGPMPENACLSRADMISDELSGNFDQGDIIAKRCSPTARENVPASGCRLSVSMPSLPDLPDVHLWRYDCSAPAAAPRKAVDRRFAARKPEPKGAASSEKPAESATLVPLPPVPELPTAALQTSTASVPLITAFQSTAAIAGDSAADSGGAVAVPAAASFEAVSVASETGPAAAAAGAPVPVDNAAPGAKELANPPTGSPQTPPPSARPALPADLAAVKASDPAAADHIASYCHSATAAAQDPASVAASCRHEEEAAWKRLVVNNEFPALNEATRRKCNEAPFPDSYVAKESCAKYQLQAR